MQQTSAAYATNCAQLEVREPPTAAPIICCRITICMQIKVNAEHLELHTNCTSTAVIHAPDSKGSAPTGPCLDAQRPTYAVSGCKLFYSKYKDKYENARLYNSSIHKLAKHEQAVLLLAECKPVRAQDCAAILQHEYHSIQRSSRLPANICLFTSVNNQEQHNLLVDVIVLIPSITERRKHAAVVCCLLRIHERQEWSDSCWWTLRSVQQYICSRLSNSVRMQMLQGTAVEQKGGR
jgi:hypothetical protein